MGNPVPTVCYMCSSECGIVVHEDRGEITDILGDTAHPMNHGGLCPKVFATPELVTHEDRIREPLKRVGERGEGRFEPITWEKALREIAERLVTLKRAEGAQTLLVQFGEKPDHDLVYRFANAYGTPNVLDHDSICDTNRREGFMFTYGMSHFRPLPDLNRPIQTDQGERREHDCRYLLLIGENPLEATRFLYLRDGIKDAIRQGMHLTVLDPFRTATARLAHDWLAVRPGSDLALVLAILRFVIERDAPEDPARRYLDHEFIRDWTVGFEDLRRFLLGSGDTFSPEWAASRTGLDAETIRRVAHELGITKPAAAMVGMNGVGHQISGFFTTRAVAMLVAITGNLDVPGGLALAPRPHLDTNRLHGCHLLPNHLAEMHKDNYAGHPLAYRGIKAKDPRDILDGVKLTHGAHAGEQYRIRSLFVIHGNPLINAPASSRWHDALTHRDESGEYDLRLLVFNDTQLNNTGLYADYVLPMASFVERQGLCQIYVNEPTISLRRPVLPPQYDSRTPLGWLGPLAEACAEAGDSDMVNAIPYDSDDEWCDEALLGCPGIKGYANGVAPNSDGARLTVEWLRAHGGSAVWPARFRKYDRLDTPSKKVEIVSATIEEANRNFDVGYEPLLSYVDDTPDRDEFPFRLITGRALSHTGSFTQNFSKTLKMQSEPVVYLSLEDATALRVVEGDWVRLRTPQGKEVRARVEPTDRLIGGVVRATHGWGQTSRFLSRSRGLGYNINLLTDDESFNEITGNAAFGNMMVAIEKENA